MLNYTSIIMAKQIFTNKDGNIFKKDFEGLLKHNSSIKWLDSVVGFVPVSDYFALCIFCNYTNIDSVFAGIAVRKR